MVMVVLADLVLELALELAVDANIVDNHDLQCR